MPYLGHKEGTFWFFVGLVVLGVVTVITYRKDPVAMLTGKLITATGAIGLLLPPLYRIVRDQLRERRTPQLKRHRALPEIPAKQALTTGTTSDATGKTDDAHDRIVISWTAEEIWEQFVGRTDLEAQQLAKRFIGTWLAVSDKIEDIMEAGDRILVFIQDQKTFRSKQLYFNKGRAVDRLMVMRQGELINALGRITEITSRTIRLSDCEFT